MSEAGGNTWKRKSIYPSTRSTDAPFLQILCPLIHQRIAVQIKGYHSTLVLLFTLERNFGQFFPEWEIVGLIMWFCVLLYAGCCRVFLYQTTFWASLLSLWIAIEGVVVYSNPIKI